MGLKDIEAIAFDADDTLWENENFFREAEREYCQVMAGYAPAGETAGSLFRVEMQNMELYGYGIKAFMLSLIETSLLLSKNRVRPDQIEAIIAIGKRMLQRDVILLDHVPDLLERLYGRYRLVLASKGDLLDQERKLKKSGLLKYFHHIGIMTNKQEENYSGLLKHLDVRPERFMMVGNSLRSDILPVIRLGGYAVHIPYFMTWEHEQMDPSEIKGDRFFELKQLHDLLALFE